MGWYQEARGWPGSTSGRSGEEGMNRMKAALTASTGKPGNLYAIYMMIKTHIALQKIKSGRFLKTVMEIFG